jgi:hypothetical protein
MDVLQAVSSIVALLLQFVATVIVGLPWIEPLSRAVRGLFKFQTGRSLEQAHQAQVKRDRIAAKMAGNPRWWDFALSEGRLAGLRALARQQNHMNKAARVRWNLPPREIVDADGFYDIDQVELNGSEIDAAIANFVTTSEPRDLRGLAFKLLLISLPFSVFGVLPF